MVRRSSGTNISRWSVEGRHVCRNDIACTLANFAGVTIDRALCYPEQGHGTSRAPCGNSDLDRPIVAQRRCGNNDLASAIVGQLAGSDFYVSTFLQSISVESWTLIFGAS